MKFFFDNPAKTVKDKLSNISLMFTFSVFWIFLVSLLFSYLYSFYDAAFDVPTFFMACIMAPLWEEMLFRYGPIELGRFLGKKAIMPIVAISSLLFGIAHGVSIWSVMVQGVMGFGLAWVYIKNGYSYWSSVLLHFLWNFFIIFVAPVLGGGG